MSKIFIGHSSADNAAALAIAQWLKRHELSDHFLDLSAAHGLKPGERWQEALHRAADRCEAVVFLISPSWRDSPWCQAEFLLAKQLGKTIFGVLIQPTPLATLRSEMTAEWQLCDLVSGDERSSFAVHQDPEVPRTTVSFATAGLARLKLGLERAGLDAKSFPWPPPDEPDRAPYRGLKPLEAADAAVFFGREVAIARSLAALRQMRSFGIKQLLVVLGASGAGKSSFLRAGLWPRLNRDDRNFLPLPLIRPGRAALTGELGLVVSLAAAYRKLGKERNRIDLREALCRPNGLSDMLAQLQHLARQRLLDDSTTPTVVIPIDQGEEFFSAEGSEEAAHLLDLLAGAMLPASGASVSGRFLAVVTIRSDSFERLQKEKRLAAVATELISLSPIAPTDYRTIIEGPARCSSAAGRRLVVMPDLAEELLRHTTGADALPLIAFTLERLLLDYGAKGELSKGDYDRLKGIDGSLDAAVKAAFAEPARPPVVPSDANERDRLLHQAFIPWLAGVDPDTDERKRRVADWEEVPMPARPLLERLIEQRLLTTHTRTAGGQRLKTVEVAHEALLRRWRSLSIWLDSDAEELKTLEAAKRAAAEWASKKKADDWLTHTGKRLESAMTLQTRPDFDKLLGDSGRDYLYACRERDIARHRQIADEQERVATEQRATAAAQRRARIVLIASAAVLSLLAVWVIKQQRGVTWQTSKVLASNAADNNNASEHDRALRYALLASARGILTLSTPDANAQLARAAYAVRQQRNFPQSTLSSAVFSPDGRHVLTSGSDKCASAWDTDSGAESDVFCREEPVSVKRAAYSPDGAHVLTVSGSTARLWSPGSKTKPHTFHHENNLRDAGFCGNGRVFTTTDLENVVRVWEFRADVPVVSLKESVIADCSRDGRRIATASSDDIVRIWDLPSDTPRRTLRHESDVIQIRFAPNGRTLITASGSNGALFDSDTGERVHLLRHDDEVTAVGFSADGQRAVTGSKDETARVWDVSSGQQIAELRDENQVVAASISGDGSRVVMGPEYGKASTWDVASEERIGVLEHFSGSVVAFSPDGKHVLTSSYNEAALWDAAPPPPVALQDGVPDARAAAFSPDGSRVAIASSEGVRLWDARSGTLIATLAEPGEPGGVIAVEFRPDGQRVAAASRHNSILWWDVQPDVLFSTRQPDQVVALGPCETCCLVGGALAYGASFAPGATYLATAWGDSGVVWETATGFVHTTLRYGHINNIGATRFSADGRRVVTASDDGSAIVWEVDTGKRLLEVIPKSEVRSAALSPDNSLLVTSSGRGTTVWNANTGLPESS